MGFTRIRSLDLEVGLAIDLELVEADPAIVRDHPDWLLTVERDGVPGRSWTYRCGLRWSTCGSG